MVDGDAVGRGIRRGHLPQLDLAGGGVEPSHHVAALHREPEGALLVEDGRVRVLGPRVRHPVLGDVAGLRVELADETGVVSRVPDVPITVGCEPVRTRVGRRQVVLGELAGGWVEPPDLVRLLGRVPEGAVGTDGWVVRQGARFRQVPLADADVQASGRPAATRRGPSGKGQEPDERGDGRDGCGSEHAQHLTSRQAVRNPSARLAWPYRTEAGVQARRRRAMRSSTVSRS